MDQAFEKCVLINKTINNEDSKQYIPYLYTIKITINRFEFLKNKIFCDTERNGSVTFYKIDLYFSTL